MENSDYSNVLYESDHLLSTHPSQHKISIVLVLSAFSCVIGTSFQFGYGTGVVNAPMEIMTSFINASHYEEYQKFLDWDELSFLWALFVSIWAIGGMLGAPISYLLCNKLSRKQVMLFNCIVFIIGSFLMTLSSVASSYAMLVLGRFISGIGAGIATCIAPLYLAEIAPISLRGAFGTLHQLAIVIGLLLSQVLGLNQLMGTSELWKYLFCVPAVASLLQIMLLPHCPESPRYLLLNGSKEQVVNALARLRGNCNNEQEVQYLLRVKMVDSGVGKINVVEFLTKSHLRKPLFICSVLHMSQQLSGINAVIYYSTFIFESTGLSVNYSQYATILTGVLNVLMTFVSILLMDKAGRRSLHLIGLTGLFIFSIILTMSMHFQSSASFLPFVSVIAILGYIASFSIGPGSIPWFITVEMFSSKSRDAAVGITVLVNWLSNFSVGLVFPYMQGHLHSLSFVPFSVLLALFIIFTWRFLPETKNRSAEEIGALFHSNHHTLMDEANNASESSTE